MHFSVRLALSGALRNYSKSAGQSGPSRTRKALIYGSSVVGVGSAIAIYRSIDSIEDLTEVGVIRFGRALVAISRIVVDYKSALSGLDDNSHEYNKVIKECHARSAHILLELAKKNGGVFIKVGQHIAAMEYLVPHEYTDTLSVLMSKAPQAPFEEVKFVVERELGQKISDVFSDFSKDPVGAASLAQVHSARLKSTGEKVAVKVQRRRVLKNSRTDMHTMEFLANVADRLFPEFKLMWLVNETKKNLPNELNFLHEAKNADKVREKFARVPFLKIPRIFYDVSTPQLLTMEYCDGVHIDNTEYMIKNGIDRHDLCRKMGRIFSEMIFLEGYLHSDPHPGNILVNKRTDGKVDIVLLDHGLYLDIDDRFRSLYSDLWLGLLNADLPKIKHVANEMGVGELYGLFACIITRRSWKSVTQGIGKSKMDMAEKMELRQYAASLIPQISEVLSRMPREMLLILKTNDLLRNLEHKLMTSSRGDSLIEMSKCVIRSHYLSELRWAKSHFAVFRIHLSMFWALLKIRAYELYLCVNEKLGIAIL